MRWRFQLTLKDPGNPQPAVLFLSGPTGIGKTALAVRLAEQYPLEIISADSMQVYRGMEIGTAQPSAEERARAAFHLCGRLEPTEPFNVQRFVELCDEAHRRILERGRVPLYVGGTGLYLRAPRWGLFDQEGRGGGGVRAALEEEARGLGPPALHRRLAELDPPTAARIAPGDAVRIVRALEVQVLTGRRMSELQAQWRSPRPRFPHVLVVLVAPRETVRRRIAERAAAMLEAGWIGETKALLERGIPLDQHCFKALGYREIVRRLRGELNESEMRRLIVARTRQFAKRQMIWFRRERPAIWLPVNDDPSILFDPLRRILDKLETPRAAIHP